MGSLGLLFFSM